MNDSEVCLPTFKNIECPHTFLRNFYMLKATCCFASQTNCLDISCPISHQFFTTPLYIYVYILNEHGYQDKK